MDLSRIVSEGDERAAIFDVQEFRSGQFEFKLGHKWIDFEISGLDETLEKIEMDAEMNVQGFLGAWIPSDDWTSDGVFPEKTLRYGGMENVDNLFVESKSWSFGQTASFLVKKSEKHQHHKSPIFKFSILLRPLMTRPKWKDEKVKLTINLKLNDLESEVRIFEMEPGNISGPGVQRMKNFYDSFEAYGATKMRGKGNIVHPKQYLTLRGVSYIMTTYIPEDKPIKLGYIGTDTTENIRSLLRWLVEESYINRIEEIVIFITTDWDKEFLDLYPFEEQIKKLCNCPVRILELSKETIELQEQQKDCDILVLTYVAPWVNQDSQAEFVDLIKNTLGDKSYLLSVDPQKAENSVRAAISSEFNNDNLYTSDQLNLRVAKRAVTKENTSVEWSVWKKKNEKSQ